MHGVGGFCSSLVCLYRETKLTLGTQSTGQTGSIGFCKAGGTLWANDCVI